MTDADPDAKPEVKTGEPDPKDKPTPNRTLNVLDIDWSKLDAKEKASLEGALGNMSSKIQELETTTTAQAKVIDSINNQRIEDKKQVILDGLATAGYDLKSFETLTLNELEATAKALGGADKEFIVPRFLEVEEPPAQPIPMIWNPTTKKLEPFHVADRETDETK